ncbi:HAD hydrolase-like protein [Chitinophaga agrisoli]|uniref:HAD hydrolase-like protein n=1 Tax=Chitinophaga agrisoli TaxID=2607653 RepID=A0A5B2VQH3_9BACT|nr:HAD hydrolase-like protein [Chitinophaga agrisoli]KAA2240497.1 HAD hydrolase-like protein [Chitinophaga agrisoli]
MSIQLAVFDIAGTTLHDESNVGLVLQQVIREQAGLPVTLPEVNEVMGYAKPYAIRYLLQQYQDSRHQDAAFVNAVHSQFVQQMSAHYEQHSSVREKTGVGNVLQALKQRGVKVALDTGFDRAITNIILRRVGWSQQGIIDAVVTSDEVPRGRPYPYMIYRAMEQLGIRSIRQVAKIGDTISDLEEGANAGCPFVIGVTTGAYTKDALEKGPHTHLVAHLDEILEII